MIQTLYVSPAEYNPFPPQYTNKSSNSFAHRFYKHAGQNGKIFFKSSKFSFLAVHTIGKYDALQYFTGLVLHKTTADNMRLDK